MDFHILGPLEVLDEGRAVPLGGSRQRALLALLLLHANETLSTDRLIDELWGEHAPATAAKMLHVQVSRLRKALAAAGGAVVTRDRGYELTLARDRLDAHRFEDLVADGGRELAAGRPDRAAAALEQALVLWRGAPLADLAYERFAQREIARLDELHVSALEQLVDAQLGLGRHAEVVGRLQSLIGEHPYRERLRAQLMLALYRCDRQADALHAYQDARRALVEELGIEPGERLRELERAVLAHDPALAPPAAAVAVQPSEPAAPEAPATQHADARRIVSVVFADLADSTALAERLDPEALHGILERCSSVCAEVLERHGGTAQEFLGDAVVGVFGLRERHEDDPLRAVRAALELREAGATLGAELERAHGIPIAARFGIDSGEVFVGPGTRGEALARGDAMNVAAGLGQAAADGEILLGERGYRLVAAAVRAERLEPLAVRGRRAEVEAWRLLGLTAAEPMALDAAATPFIGRERELDALRAAVARAGSERSCRLVTVVGPPGIGKSRLARELVATVGSDAAVVVGRCLSYGEGITYRPLAEMVRQLAGDDPERWIRELLAGDERAESIALRVLGAIGRSDESAQAGETFWAVRRLFEAVARERTLVVLVEDAHWADPTLLDLLEYVLAFSSGFPILLVCLARPELLESRPAWAASQPSGSVLVLEALGSADALAMVTTIAGGELDPLGADRVVATAEGNPLFLEQLLAVGAEGDLTALPPSIEAVLAARIDQLEPGDAKGARARVGRGQELPCRRGRRAGGERRAGRRRNGAHGSRAEAADPPGPARVRRRGRVPVLACAGPRRRVQRPAEAAARRAARADGRLAAGEAARPRRDPRLPPRAGLSLPARAGPRRRRLARARARGGGAARGGRSGGARARRRRRRGASPRARGVARPAGGSGAPGAAVDARGDARRGGQARGRRPLPGGGDRARRGRRRSAPGVTRPRRAGARTAPRGDEPRCRAGAGGGGHGPGAARAPRRRPRPLPGVAPAGVDRVDREPRGRGR